MARNITVTFDDGTSHVYQNAPDNLTPDMVQQRAQQDFGKTVTSLDGGKSAAPAGEGMPSQRREPTMTERMLGTPAARFALGAVSPLVGAVQLGANIGDYANEKMGVKPVVSKAIADWWNNVQAMKEKGMETPEQRLLGAANPDVMGTVGNVATGVLGLPSTAATVGQKILSGAKMGAVFGATQPGTTSLQQNALGAGIGGVVGATAPFVPGAIAKSTGWMGDVVSGNLPTTKAADIARKAAGDQIGAIRAALSGAKPNISPGQATAGIQKNTWQTLNDLSSQTDANATLLKNQADDQLAALASLAEGGNATEARAAQDQSKVLLNQLTERMRQTELGAANQANETINQLAPKLEQRQASMVNALRQGMPANLPSGAAGTPVPGVSGIHPETEALQRANVANDAARRLMVARSQAARGGISESTVPGANDRRIESANRFVSDQWQEAADTFGQIASQRRNEAGFIERQIGSLADHGLKPLDAGNITASLDSTMNAPGTRASPILTKTLQAIKDDIATLTEKGGGVIDAHDLYTLRKEGISERIAQLLGPTDPKTSSKLTAKVLTQVRPMIDKAIEDAGGTGWSKYLNTYSQGMQAIDQKAMAAEAMRLFKDSPKAYVDLVRGNSPDAVEAIFGKGSYDIFKEMGSKMPTLEKVASDLERTKSMSEASQRGVQELGNIMDPKTFKLRFPFFGKTASVANMVIGDLENRVSASTMAKLREGMATNQSTLDLLNTVPTADKNEILKALANAGSIGSKAVSSFIATQPAAQLSNALAPKRSKQNALIGQ